MYFKSRAEAGKLLAKKMEQYKNEDCAIVALSDGGVVVASQIASVLNCVITMLLMEPIKLPGEPDPIAVINQDGGFTYNNMYSTGQLEEFESEYYHYIEQAKTENLNKMHRLLGEGGLIDKDLLRNKTIILVSDGLNNGFSIDAAIDYLKTVKINKIIVITPLANVSAVDRMHVAADEIQCLSVIENYLNTNHYYEKNDVPSHEKIIATVQAVVEKWEDGEQNEKAKNEEELKAGVPVIKEETKAKTEKKEKTDKTDGYSGELTIPK